MLVMFQLTKTALKPCRRCYSNRNILKLRERGMFHDIFPDSAAGSITDLLNAAPQTVYGGFDPTADSLHVGNLLILVNLLHWQRGGHQVIALVGGATAKIGDPSGRNTEREELSKGFVDGNIRGIVDNINTIFTNHKKHLWKDNNTLKPPKILNNETWYGAMTPIDLISKAGRHLRMGTLLSRTSVQKRLQSPVGMSFTEFSYQLFQAYDWLHLCQNYNCTFQVGGNDQMGNIMSGQELISKTLKKQVYGLTMPLITSEMGDKFGKSAGNAVWLSPHKTSPFTFYQFWIRQPDSEAEKLLKLFTFDPVGSISDIIRRHREKPELRLPQKSLAEQVTLLVHGEDGLQLAKDASKALYEADVNVLSKMLPQDIKELFQGAAIVDILPEAGMNMIDLAMKAGCFRMKNDAVRIIGAGGFHVNHQKIKNAEEVINLDVHRLQNGITLLRVGKKNYYIVQWT